MEFSGKVVWITGGGGRIGPVIASFFSREGAQVGLSDVVPGGMEPAVAGIRADGGAAASFVGDVAEEADVERVLAGITAALGPVDILVNNHGVASYLPLVEMDLKTWQHPFRVNTQGCFLTCRAVARQLIARGRPGSIVNVSSHNATSGRRGGSAYTASKAAVDALSMIFAMELGPHGIRVNVVTPGLITSPAPLGPGDGGTPFQKMMIEMTPLGRTGEPSDIAAAVLAVASDRMPFLTGSNLQVTGGSHTGRTTAPLTRRGIHGS